MSMVSAAPTDSDPSDPSDPDGSLASNEDVGANVHTYRGSEMVFSPFGPCKFLVSPHRPKIVLPSSHRSAACVSFSAARHTAYTPKLRACPLQLEVCLIISYSCGPLIEIAIDRNMTFSLRLVHSYCSAKCLLSGPLVSGRGHRQSR